MRQTKPYQLAPVFRRNFPLLAVCLALSSTCLAPATDRTEAESRLGSARAGNVRVEVERRSAYVRSIESGRALIYALSPVVRLRLSAAENATTTWEIEVHNVMPSASWNVVSTRSGKATIALSEKPLPTRGIWSFTLEPGTDVTLELAPPDSDSDRPFKFGVLSDVQRALDEVEDIFTRMNQDEDLRFVVSTGDLTESGTREQIETYIEKSRRLNIPIYSTVGNHELGAREFFWADYFGQFNYQFDFRGVFFTMLDSASATIDPLVYEWLEEWVQTGNENVHVVLTHYAPIDPVGTRNGSFRSRKEGAKVLKILADGGVDALFHGHVHSYYAFSGAGIPSYISGGGGAIPEKLDGINRHYLTVWAEPGRRIRDVSVVRIEEDQLPN